MARVTTKYMEIYFDKYRAILAKVAAATLALSAAR